MSYPPRPGSFDRSRVLGYFITFRCYGTWLHGDARGSIDARHAEFGAPRLQYDPAWEERRRKQMKYPAYTLGRRHRAIVADAIRGVVAYRGWTLPALNVRTQHVHQVVSGPDEPETAMTQFKGWATRRLREAGLVDGDNEVWSRHGSTKYLYSRHAVDAAVDYVITRQG